MREIYIGYLMEDSSPYNGNCNLQQIGFTYLLTYLL